MVPFSKHPLLVLGAGLAVGFLIHKYRNEIIERARLAGEQTNAILRGPRAPLENLGATDETAPPDATGA